MTPADIKSWRFKHGWTQPELAEAIGSHRCAIAVIEKGRRAISPTMEQRLKRFFSFYKLCQETGRL
jgi:transcriptional regulator with XRE-family HTH domain